MLKQPDPYFDDALAFDLREREAEAAHWDAEIEKDLERERAGLGWSWRPEWGNQPHDEHVRDMLRSLEVKS